ncbi:MAG TPA: peptidoglycan DD-metalloendopeptidase family protein, partial [Thermomicrobiales bacterium]|nr:peptidoglycan DD-metalloendopeptidase family protein [Thermomicrobiales bacterium]
AAEIALGSGGANIREEADAKSDKLETLNEGVVVEVVDGPTYDADGAPWYLVKFTSDKRGFVIAEALAATSSDSSGLSSDTAPVSSTGATGTYIYPIAKYTFTQGYGCTIYSFEPYNSDLGCYYHNGLDLAAPLGTALVASDGGTVLYAGWCDCGLGLYVAIDHGNGMSTLYGHMNAVYVTAGQKVTQGEQIGEVGTTGNSTGPHCHFIIKSGDSTVNPLDYLPPLSSS